MEKEKFRFNRARLCHSAPVSVLFAVVFGLSMMTGCAHRKIENALDEKIANETPKNRAEIQNEAKRAIDSAPGLSEDQKSRLNALRVSVRGKLDLASSQSAKLRSILIQDVLSKDGIPDEVNAIQKRIRRVEEGRLTVIFDAVARANEILGREAKGRVSLMEDFLGSRESSHEP